MNTKMFVGNLPYSSTEDELRQLYSTYGNVSDVFLPVDRQTGRIRGFAFVTMGSAEEMQAAIAGTDSKEWNGRTLKVNEAQPKPQGPRYEGGGGGGGGYSRGGGGGGGGRGGYGNDRGGYGNDRGGNQGARRPRW